MVRAGIDFDQDDIFPWKDISGNFIAWSSVDHTGGWIYWNHLARFVYDRINHLVTAYAPPQAGHDFINQIYLENTLPFILSLRGYEVIHASAVLTAKGVVAFSALSGTGKSTFAYTLQTRGYVVWADDVVIFRPNQDAFLCAPIPFNLRLYPETIVEVKNYILDHQSGIDRDTTLQLEPKPFAAICLLKRIDEENAQDNVSIVKLPLQEAYTQLLPHAYNFELNNPTRSRQMMVSYLNLVSTIPIYQLSYTKGMSSLSKLIDNLETTILWKDNSI